MTQLHEDSLETTTGENTSGLPGILGVAWRHKYLILLGGVIGTVLGALYYARQPVIYQSSAMVLLSKKQPDLPIQGIDFKQGYMAEYLNTHLLDQKTPLHALSEPSKAKLRTLKSLAGIADPTEAVINSVVVGLESKGPSTSTSFLTFSYKGQVPEDCRAILEVVVESYRDFLVKTPKQVNDDTMALIQSARDILNKDLSKAIKEYRTFREKSKLVFTGKDRTTLQQDRLQTLEAKRLALQLRRAEIEARIEIIQSALRDGRDPTPFLHMPLDADKAYAKVKTQSPTLTIEDQLFSMFLQEQQLLEVYGPEHPQLKSLRRKMELVRDFYARKGEAFAETARLSASAKALSKKESAQERIATLQQELEDIKVEERGLAAIFAREHQQWKGVEEQIYEEEELRRKVDLTRQMFESVLKRMQEVGFEKRFQEASVEKDLGQMGYRFQLRTPPGIGVRIAPRATPIFGMAICGGLLAGFGLAWLADASDKTFRTPEEIRRRLGLAIVGHIPNLEVDEAARARAQAEGLVDPSLWVHHRPKSPEAEAFRGIRTALYFSTQGEGHKVLQMTSPDMGDGKSTVMANLALSIAQSGKRILLIDADFRRPRVHKLFAVGSEVGLASVITGDAELQEAIQPTAIPNLAVLPCGPRPPNPAELLTSPRFKELLDVLREQYDFVLVDTPPLLAVSDPSVVAPRVDGVLLTIRIAKNGRPSAERAKEVLATLGAKVLGVIVNGVGEQGKYGYGRSGYGYNYSYGYAYNYGYYREDAEDSETETNGKTNHLHRREITFPTPSEVSAEVPEVDVPVSRQRQRSRKKPRGLLEWLRGWLS